MRLLTVSLALLFLLVPVVSAAQQDTTPPALLDFTISPVVFCTHTNRATFPSAGRADEPEGAG
jgi:hypothetical protein